MEDLNEEKKNGQRNYKCLIIGCEDMGRKVGKLGNIVLSYCPKHRDYGTRILNFLIDSRFRGRFIDFLDETKRDLFVKNEPSLCEICNQKIADYVISKTEELNKLENE